MICLGIESSCDDTAVALVGDGRLLASKTASQAEIHALFGGVVPELASRRHYQALGPLFDMALEQAGLCANDIDVIAVARGPGLLGSLLVGVSFAKALAFGLDKPLLGINHLHAHLLATGLTMPVIYPGIAMLVSGGHTHIYRVESPASFIQLGRSLDDAAGEAFDKVGTALGLDYPAGRAIDQLAAGGDDQAIALPRPYLDNSNLDFSFSGLKTAAIEHLRQQNLLRQGRRPTKAVHDFCASLNRAVADTLVTKTGRALLANRDAKAVWLAGGVAANSMIRQAFAQLAASQHLPLLMPQVDLCGDNAAMTAYAGWLLANAGYYHDLGMETIPRGMTIPDDMRQACHPLA